MAMRRTRTGRRQLAVIEDIPRAMPMTATRSVFVPRPIGRQTFFSARRAPSFRRVRRFDSLPEKKFFDTALSFFVDSTGEVPATGQLSLIVQGDTESTRDGRQCTVESIQIRAKAEFAPAATATASTNIWIYLVLDTQANGAAAGATDVLTSTAFHSALINLANSGRFRILKKFKLNFTSAAGVTTAYNNNSKHIDYFTKCNIPLEFSGATGAITELKSNNIFLLAGSDATASGDDTVGVNGNCRLRFRG